MHLVSALYYGSVASRVPAQGEGGGPSGGSWELLAGSWELLVVKCQRNVARSPCSSA